MGVGHEAVTAMAVALLGLIAAMGAGRWLAHGDGPTQWAHALVTGMLLWGLIGLVLGSLGLITPVAFGAVGAVSLLGWTRGRLSRPAWATIAASACLVLPGVIDALGPITGTDEQYLHVGLPQQLLLYGELVGGPLHPNGSRPLLLQLVYTGLLSSGESRSIACFHWLLSASTVALTIQMGRHRLGGWKIGLMAAAMLGLSTTFQESTGQAASDLPTAFAVLVALDAVAIGRHRVAMMAAAAAISIKYTAVAPLAGILLTAGLRPLLAGRLAVGALLLVSPWWLRNAWNDLHPLFPFMGWPDPQLSFQFAEKWGAGRSLIDFLYLPYRAVFDADPNTHLFHGRIHPLLILCLLPVPLAWRSRTLRPWFGAAALGLIGWATGPHWLRYLIPTLPIVALLGAAVVIPLASGRWRRFGIIAALLCWAPSGLKGMEGRWSESRVALKDGLPAPAEAIEFSNQHLPDDATVALLFDWNSAAIHRRQVLGSVEDHNPSRHFFLRHADDPIGALVRQGATHAVVRTVNFPKSHYAFLDPNRYKREFIAPLQTMNDGLLMEAELLYAGPLHRVYRLPTD